MVVIWGQSVLSAAFVGQDLAGCRMRRYGCGVWRVIDGWLGVDWRLEIRGPASFPPKLWTAKRLDSLEPELRAAHHQNIHSRENRENQCITMAANPCTITVVHCWSAPRSRSTAMLYSFESRGADTVALDEPLVSLLRCDKMM